MECFSSAESVQLGNPLPSCSLCLPLFSRRAYCEKFLVFRCQQGEVARHVAAWLLLSQMQRRKVRIHYASRLSIFVVMWQVRPRCRILWVLVVPIMHLSLGTPTPPTPEKRGALGFLSFKKQKMLHIIGTIF